MGHHEWTLDEGVIRDDVHWATSIIRGKRQEHLEDEVGDKGAVLAAREPDDPRKIVSFQVFIAKIGANAGDHPI
jgi:hypothetical protein